VTLVLGAPFRMYWRRDSTLLARLPIAGPALFRLASWLALRSAAGYLLALGLAAAPLFLFLDAGPIARLLLLGGALVIAGMLSSTVAGTVAGAIVVSAKTQELIREVSSGQVAPGVVWLSMVPAAFAVGVVLVGYEAATAPRTPVVLLAATVGVAAILHEVTRRLLAPALSDATREVAALDAVRNAHVDLVGPRGLERAWGTLAGAARPLYEKDVTVMRRRHPGFYLLTGLGVIALWLVAFLAGEPERTQVVLAGAAALAAYALLAARRLTVPPSEHPRLLATLPLGASAVARAKTAHVAWRAVWAIVVGGAPAVIRSPRPLVVAGGLALILAATIAAGAWLVRRD
jgi:hypothetical protein